MTQDIDEIRTVVIHNGSSEIQSGFGGENLPRSVFPSIIGRPKLKSATERRDFFIGDEASSKWPVLNITHPIPNGIIENFDDMEKIWDYIFKVELKVDPSNSPVIFSEPPLNPKMNREKTIQIMFEKFGVPSFYIGNQSVFALFSDGKETGIVLDANKKDSYVVPIYENHSIPYATKILYEYDDYSYEVFNSINQLDNDFRNIFFNNIVIAGNNIFDEPEVNIERFITENAPSSAKVKITQCNESKYASWIGGSILSYLTIAPILFITQDEFKEYGSGFIHKKCIL